jgi:hypothetical protein
MIGEQVLKNLRPSTDFAEVHERLTFLDRFREAVGENAPDELVGLSREVNQAYHKAKPQVEQNLAAVLRWVSPQRSTVSPTSLISELVCLKP